jgi:ribose transport system permease protein
VRPALRTIDRPILVAAGFIAVILGVGSTINTSFVSPTYLLQQLQVASFLGIMASGMMLVILLGQIDLSLPWTVTMGAMMAAAVGRYGPWGEAFAIPFGMLCGLAVGIVNGLGYAMLRVPSMIFTLGMNAVVQGLMVFYSGGFAPLTKATPLMQTLAVDRTFGIPNALFVWMAITLALALALKITPFGRYVYAIGNRESAAYLSGVRTRLVTVACFAINGATAALAGVMLTGYSTNAYQGMGDPYLLPAIAAIVLGGTNILGGRGSYLGTVVGVILIVLLQSMLSVMQMPEAGRQIIYGVVIVAMLLVYGRGARVES